MYNHRLIKKSSLQRERRANDTQKDNAEEVPWQCLQTQFSDLASSMNLKQKNKSTQTYHSKIKITKLNGKILISSREKHNLNKNG